MNKATLTRKHIGIKSSHRLDDLFKAYKVLDSKFNEIVDCRTYFTRGGNCTCCVWVVSSSSRVSGSGYAGGGDYDKLSSAISTALHNAGFDFEKDFDGAGERAAEEALLAVARCVAGQRKFHLVKCYA